VTPADRGESLVELLVAVVVMGLAVVVIVGGFASGIMMSDLHRKQATTGAYVRDYAEAIENTVGGGGYVDCAGTATYASPAGFSTPSGYTPSVVPGSVRYWSGAAWQSSCGTDTGLQQLTVQVASADGRASERLTIVLRKPCRLTDAPCH
jgi:hypothetical protein